MRIAVFIDAENIAVDAYGEVGRHLGTLGRIVLARAIGDFAAPPLSPWRNAAPLLGIDLGFQPGCGKAKNGADIALAAEAMEAALSARFDALAIVSGDGDFTPLAMRVRRLGLAVFGYARSGTASPYFRAACTSFTELSPPTPALRRPPTPAPALPTPPSTPSSLPSLSAADRKAVLELLREACALGQGLAAPGPFGAQMRSRYPLLAGRIGGPGKLVRNLVQLGLAERCGTTPNVMLRLPQLGQKPPH